MDLPEPQNYTDGVAFFHDIHKVVLHTCAVLDGLLDDAAKEGVFPSFAAKPEWKGVFRFFEKVAPNHERDEEQFLFPALVAKLPRVGFQSADTPIRFLLEGHEVLQKKAIPLVRDWQDFLKKERDPRSLEASRERHAAEDADFIATGRELVRLYREHVATEETKVYNLADQILNADEKLALAEALQSQYGNERVTGIYEFEEPQYSDPKYGTQYVTDAQAGNVLDAEYEDEEEDS